MVSTIRNLAVTFLTTNKGEEDRHYLHSLQTKGESTMARNHWRPEIATQAQAKDGIVYDDRGRSFGIRRVM